MKILALVAALFLAYIPIGAQAACVERSYIEGLYEEELKIVRQLNEVETKAFLARYKEVFGEEPPTAATIDAWELKAGNSKVLVIHYDENGCFILDAIFPKVIFELLANGGEA